MKQPAITQNDSNTHNDRIKYEYMKHASPLVHKRLKKREKIQVINSAQVRYKHGWESDDDNDMHDNCLPSFLSPFLEYLMIAVVVLREKVFFSPALVA